MKFSPSLLSKKYLILIASFLIVYVVALNVAYFASLSVVVFAIVLVCSIALFLVGIYIVVKKYAFYLKKVSYALKLLSDGKIDKYGSLDLNVGGELGEIFVLLNTLSIKLKNTVNFVKTIGNGESASKENIENQYMLGSELHELNNKLIEANERESLRRTEEERQNWISTGLTKFNEILRLHNHDLSVLSYNLISNLVDYVGAVQGGAFVRNDDNINEICYELSGFVAYDRRKMAEAKFKVGNSLVGRCAYEKQSIYIEEVPENYVHVTSGLGEANPRALLLVPALLENEVYAILELVSFKKMMPHQISFIEKLGESIASTFANVKANERTRKLLDQSKHHAEEIAAHEEELRQNFEELQATQDEVSRLREEEKRSSQKMIDEVEKYKSALLRIVDHIPVKVFLKDNTGKMLFVNKKVLEVHNAKSEDLLGKSDFDFIDDYEVAKKYWDKEQNIIKSGIPEKVIHEETINDTGMVLDSTTFPFYIDFLGETGILGVQLDITDNVNKDKRIAKLEDQINELTGQNK